MSGLYEHHTAQQDGGGKLEWWAERGRQPPLL